MHKRKPLTSEEVKAATQLQVAFASAPPELLPEILEDLARRFYTGKLGCFTVGSLFGMLIAAATQGRLAGTAVLTGLLMVALAANWSKL